MATNTGFDVRVEGLSKVLRLMSSAGVDAKENKVLMHRIGNIVKDAANPPHGKTGRLAGSLRAGRGKTKAVVRAGGAKVPYAGVIHYGWPARGIAATDFLTNALQSRQGAVLAELDNGIGDILKKHDLI